MKPLVAGMGANPDGFGSLFPACPQYGARDVAGFMVPSGLDQQPPDVGVAGLGDRALAA